MAPGKYPGSSGTRNLHDNLSDLRAQVAANQKVHIRMYTCIIACTLGLQLFAGTNFSRFRK